MSRATIVEPTAESLSETVRRKGGNLEEVKEQKTEALSPEQRQDVLLGRAPRTIPNEPKSKAPIKKRDLAAAPIESPGAVRILLVADSGIGKTTLLHRSALEISTNEGDERIAILVEGLSDYAESTDTKHFLELVCKRLVEKHLRPVPNDQGRPLPSLENLREWFQRKVERGEVVFLLDAFDQMSNYRQNIDAICDGLHGCAVLLTTRPDQVSHEKLPRGSSTWDWRQVDLRPFAEHDARHYLGELADLFFELLEQDAGSERGETANEQNPLTIPLLLHLLRRYAHDVKMSPTSNATDFPELKNRYAIYRHVIAGPGGLLDKGLESLKRQGEQGKLTVRFLSLDDAFLKLRQVAGWLALRHHFDTFVQRELFQESLTQISEVIFRGVYADVEVADALKQLNLVTALSIFEDPKKASGMKWRHRSFLEFFAGCRLAELWQNVSTRSQAKDLLADIHRLLDTDGEVRLFETISTTGETSFVFRDLRQDWDWTLRFALSHAHDETRQNVPARLRNDARSELARELIGMGNPRVVYRAIKEDRLELARDVEQAVRWLVHRDNACRHYRDAWREKSVMVSQLTDATRQSLTNSLNRSLRDSACFVPATELLGNWQFESFPAAEQHAILGKLVPFIREERSEFVASQPAFENFLNQFVKVSGGTFNASKYYNDLSAKDWHAAGVTNPNEIIFPDLEMADFPVTNEIFELFDPGHYRWRSKSIREDQQPALWVNWFMANAFCAWMTAQDPAHIYRLPTEWEWEWACRWGGNFAGPSSWWDVEFAQLIDRCIQNEREHQPRQINTRQEAIDRFKREKTRHSSRATDPNDVGLLDLQGKVWEWCSNVHHSAGSSGRVLRTGSWRNDAIYCRSAHSMNVDPAERDSYFGFRVVREISSPSQSSS
jgi:formylglycine-generating enzyme required for sulfatase activity